MQRTTYFPVNSLLCERSVQSPDEKIHSKKSGIKKYQPSKSGLTELSRYGPSVLNFPRNYRNTSPPAEKRKLPTIISLETFSRIISKNTPLPRDELEASSQQQLPRLPADLRKTDRVVDPADLRKTDSVVESIESEKSILEKSEALKKIVGINNQFVRRRSVVPLIRTSTGDLVTSGEGVLVGAVRTSPGGTQTVRRDKGKAPKVEEPELIRTREVQQEGPSGQRVNVVTGSFDPSGIVPKKTTKQKRAAENAAKKKLARES